jgi:hypothetical protein
MYPEDLGMVPNRATVNMGPHRIGFVGEPVVFYGGYSYQRWRVAAKGHQWSATGSPIIYLASDLGQQYYGGPQPSRAQFIWNTPGIYEVSLSAGQADPHEPNNGVTTARHTGTRQVIIFPSREQAYSGIVDVSGVTGSIDQGGWSCSLRAKNTLDFLMDARTLQGYIPVIVYVDQWFEESYGTWTRHEIGPNWQSGDNRDDPRILFSGYLNNASIVENHDDNSVTFQCRTADMILENMQSHTVGFFESAVDGSGMIFNDLMTHDVARFMLQEYSNFTQWHDTRFFYNQYSYSGGTSPRIEYKDWTWNQGMYLSNIKDAAANEFYVAYVDNQSALHVVPDRNMWPPDTFEHATDSYCARLTPEGEPLSIVRREFVDGEPTVVPLEVRISERLSTGISYYKIVASLSFWNEEWGADYPHGQPLAASGKWELDQGRYYSNQDRDHAWQLLWEFVARGFAAKNARYAVELVFGQHLYWRLGDLIEVIFADRQQRVQFETGTPHTNYFEVVGISYDISMEQRQWRTTYQLRQLTTYTAPTQAIPAIPAFPTETP